MTQTCEKCGSTQFESRWLGLCYEFRCVKCLWGAATTRFPPIKTDETIYRIIIVALGPYPKQSLVALNQRFDHGIQRTRELFTDGEREFFSGNASELLAETTWLRSQQIPFSIEPEFPYNLDSSGREHEYDWQPIDNSF
jgi:hypothetical protein